MSRKGHISRREFLAVGAATTASVLAGRPSSAASARHVHGANGTIGLGYIGAGARGRALMAGFSALPSVRHVAVCDAYGPRRRSAAQATGAAEVARWEDVLTHPGVDAVVIATPDHWHAVMGIAALEAGKDVYCERPMALSIEEASRFRDTARRTGGIVQVGVQETSEGQWHEVARVFEETRALGRVLWSQGGYSKLDAATSVSRESVNVHELDWTAFEGPAKAHPCTLGRFLNWRHYWDYSGGIAMQQHYHKLAPLLVALNEGSPSRAAAAGGVYARDGREVPDMFVMTLEYAAGHSIVLASSVLTERELPAVFRAEHGTLYAEGPRLRLVYEHDIAAGSFDGEILDVTPRQGHLENWLDSIRDRIQPVCNVDVGYHTSVALAMAVRAYRENRAQDLGTVTA